MDYRGRVALTSIVLVAPSLQYGTTSTATCASSSAGCGSGGGEGGATTTIGGGEAGGEGGGAADLENKRMLESENESIFSTTCHTCT